LTNLDAATRCIKAELHGSKILIEINTIQNRSRFVAGPPNYTNKGSRKGRGAGAKDAKQK